MVIAHERKWGIKNIVSNQTTRGKCASLLFSGQTVRVLVWSQRNCVQVPPQLDRLYPRICLQSILLHWCVQESCGFFPPQPFFFGSTYICQIRGRETINAISKDHQSRNEADQDRYLHTPANATSQITLMPCARSLSFQAVSLRSAPSPPFFWCDRGERVSPDAY